MSLGEEENLQRGSLGLDGLCSRIDGEKKAHELASLLITLQQIDAIRAGGPVRRIPQHRVERICRPVVEEVFGKAKRDSSEGGT